MYGISFKHRVFPFSQKTVAVISHYALPHNCELQSPNITDARARTSFLRPQAGNFRDVGVGASASLRVEI